MNAAKRIGYQELLDPRTGKSIPLAMRIHSAKGAGVTPYFILVSEDEWNESPRRTTTLDAMTLHSAFVHSLPWLTTARMTKGYVDDLLNGRIVFNTGMSPEQRMALKEVEGMIRDELNSIVA